MLAMKEGSMLCHYTFVIMFPLQQQTTSQIISSFLVIIINAILCRCHSSNCSMKLSTDSSIVIYNPDGAHSSAQQLVLLSCSGNYVLNPSSKSTVLDSIILSLYCTC